MIGGRLLGAGKYGCTFEPAPRCANGRVFKSIRVGDKEWPAVGKVTTDDVTDEFAFGKRIMTLPLATNYFALPTETCPVDRAAVDTDPEAAQCEEIVEHPDATLTMMIMPNAGIPLNKWVEADRPRFAAAFFRLAVHLLEGMVLYQSVDAVHNDLHGNNVLVDALGTARFIDFGLAFRTDANLDAKTARVVVGGRFRPQYVLTPPEIHLWRLIGTSMPAAAALTSGLDAMRAAHRNDIAMMETQFPSRMRYELALIGLARTDPAFVRRDDLAFARTYGKRFDSWRIGLMLWWLWTEEFIPWAGHRKTEAWRRRTNFRRAIGGLTEFDVRKRMTVSEALATLDPTNRFAATK